MVIEQSINKYLKQVDFKSRRSVNGSGFGGGSSDRSDMTCHKCGKKGHMKKDYKPKGYGYVGNTPKKSTTELPEWVTKKPVVLYTKYLAKAIITRNKNKYKCFISCNYFNCAWVFHWKDGHHEWENKQVKKSSVCFPNPATNAIIYCSYLMTTSEESTE